MGRKNNFKKRTGLKTLPDIELNCPVWPHKASLSCGSLHQDELRLHLMMLQPLCSALVTMLHWPITTHHRLFFHNITDRRDIMSTKLHHPLQCLQMLRTLLLYDFMLPLSDLNQKVMHEPAWWGQHLSLVFQSETNFSAEGWLFWILHSWISLQCIVFWKL